MAIIGVLLGFLFGTTICGLVYTWRELDARTSEMAGLLQKMADRIVALEHRRSTLAVPQTEDTTRSTAANPQPFKRNLTWSEVQRDAEAGKEPVKGKSN